MNYSQSNDASNECKQIVNCFNNKFVNIISAVFDSLLNVFVVVVVVAFTHFIPPMILINFLFLFSLFPLSHHLFVSSSFLNDYYPNISPMYVIYFLHSFFPIHFIKRCFACFCVGVCLCLCMYMFCFCI